MPVQTPQVVISRAWGACLTLALAACVQSPVAPPVQPPALALPADFREPLPWVAASPADALPRDAWWTIYRDPTLDALQQRLLASSPDLAAALARYDQARASTTQVAAAQLPTVNTSLALQRNRQSEKRPLRVLGPNSPNDYSSDTLGIDIGYELDLWGRVRHLVEGGLAGEQAAQADLAAARLLLQAQLADSWMQLRGLERDAQLLRDTEAALLKALDLATQRHDAGLASGLDVARAQAQLAATRSQAHQSRAQRGLVEHAIATLVGDAGPVLALPDAGSASSTDAGHAAAPVATDAPLPPLPTGLPATLLQRRPDIAAAERRVAAANASLGVARTAYFPAVTLSAVGGYQTSDLAHFLRAPNLFWTLGPTLAANLFDGGRRRAEEARVTAVLEEAGARYRAQVLLAFQQVEDNLLLLTQYAEAGAQEALAVAGRSPHARAGHPALQRRRGQLPGSGDRPNHAAAGPTQRARPGHSAGAGPMCNWFAPWAVVGNHHKLRRSPHRTARRSLDAADAWHQGRRPAGPIEGLNGLHRGCGAGYPNRTDDLPLTRRLLYQLS